MWHSAIHMTAIASAEEMAEVGHVMAEKLNKAEGPVAVVLLLQGMGPFPMFGLEINAELRKRWAAS